MISSRDLLFIYVLGVVNWVRHDRSLEISWHPFLMSSVIIWGHNLVIRLIYWFDRLVGLSLGRKSHREDSYIFTLPLNWWCNGTCNGTCVMVSVCLPSHDGLYVTFKWFGIEGLGKYVCWLQWRIYLMYAYFARIYVESEMMQFHSDVFCTWSPFMDHRHFYGTGVIFEHSAVHFYLMVKDVESFLLHFLQKLHKRDDLS